MNLTAKDIMNEKVYPVYEDWSVDRIAEFLVEYSISGAPVLSFDRILVGVVSLTDIVRHGSMSAKNITPAEPHDYYIRGLTHNYTIDEFAGMHITEESNITARDIMTPMIFKVDENTSIQNVADTMIRGHIHRLFVTRDDKMVGIITSMDMLKVIRDI